MLEKEEELWDAQGVEKKSSRGIEQSANEMLSSDDDADSEIACIWELPRRNPLPCERQ